MHADCPGWRLAIARIVVRWCSIEERIRNRLGLPHDFCGAEGSVATLAGSADRRPED